MFRINRELDYTAVIDHDQHESWGSSSLYPAIVRIHTEMPAQDVPLHWHLGAELVYVRHGRVRLFIDGIETTIVDGQACLVSPRALHAIYPEPDDDGQCVLSISFDGEFLSRLSPGLSNRRLMQAVAIAAEEPPSEGHAHAPRNHGGERPVVRDSTLISLCEEVIACVDDFDPELRLLRLNELLYGMLVHVLAECWERDGGDSGAMASARSSAEIYAVIEYMEHHFHSGVTIGELAERFGYSREYFSRLFKKHAGVTPEQYLTEIRLQSAVDDLLNGSDTNADIARNNGFSSAKAFSRAFSNRFSLTPSVFRRTHRNTQ
ncbi:helix-turn-helix transcriptional regulator [Bifidobacterium eulemuris]|nr:helix-turn-helix transcriptional regulator [Bifidobacterium eulemuris]